MLLNPTNRPRAPLREPEIKPKHLHEYMRSIANKNIYRCVDPDCTHYQSREFLEGKRARCYKCKREMLLTKNQLKNRVPVCTECTKSKAGKRIRGVKDLLTEILPPEVQS
jgi:formylmethanofuran dehydrogenase subunit E